MLSFSYVVKQKLNFGYIEAQPAMGTKVVFHFWLDKICSVPSDNNLIIISGDIILLSHTFVTSESIPQHPKSKHRAACPPKDSIWNQMQLLGC